MRRHTVEARERAVQLLLEADPGGRGRRAASERIARRTGVGAAQLRRWAAQHELSHRTGGPPAAPAGRSTTGRRGPAPSLTLVRGAALAGLVTAGASPLLAFPVTATTAMVAGLLPVWLPHLGRWRGARLVSVLGVAAVLGGLVLQVTGTHDTSQRVATATIVHLLSAVGLFGFVLWTRSVLPVWLIAVAYGGGILVNGALDSAASPNPWKYELGLAVTTIVLALAQSTRRSLPPAVAVLALGVVWAAQDTRSALGISVLTAVVVLWQAVPRRSAVGRTGWSRLAQVGLLAAASYGVYALATSLLTSGLLGVTLQQRSAAQVAQGNGSLLVGARPELTASLALLADTPAGFGPGAVPERGDVMIAKAAMAQVGISPDNGYVDEYMFGGHFELHSVLADAWVNFGWAGAAFVIALTCVLLNALLMRFAARTASAVLTFWSLYSLWWIGFGPLYTNLPDVAFTLGIAVVAAVPRTRTRPQAPRPPLPAGRHAAVDAGPGPLTPGGRGRPGPR
ncbi:hypothetical protein GTR02_06210 [Kineococcus sp. R8]|uniref:transposase n=1 Tax=Kineococcus siccus TaxID=2696567 RepID=UPI0014128A46|nr:transposase [Kineococcus siccus]NAZ81406.1 hypothetical protein [Kineococcus siccus]